MRSRCRQTWFLVKPLFLVYRWLPSPCIFTRSSVCMCLCPRFFFFFSETNYIGLGLIVMTHFNLFKDLVSTYSYVLSYWGLELQHRNLAGTQFSLSYVPLRASSVGSMELTCGAAVLWTLRAHTWFSPGWWAASADRHLWVFVCKISATQTWGPRREQADLVWGSGWEE